eukprot:4150627-Prymnesium_polylepis.1
MRCRAVPTPRRQLPHPPPLPSPHARRTSELPKSSIPLLRPRVERESRGREGRVLRLRGGARLQHGRRDHDDQREVEARLGDLLQPCRRAERRRQRAVGARRRARGEPGRGWAPYAARRDSAGKVCLALQCTPPRRGWVGARAGGFRVGTGGCAWRVCAPSAMMSPAVLLIALVGGWARTQPNLEGSRPEIGCLPHAQAPQRNARVTRRR